LTYNILDAFSFLLCVLCVPLIYFSGLYHRSDATSKSAFYHCSVIFLLLGLYLPFITVSVLSYITRR